MDRILIIEDDPVIGSLLLDICREGGFEARLLTEGERAPKLLAAEHYDLVLLDLMLPGVQGEEVLRRVRAVNQLPVIVLSAKNGLDTRVELLTGGADDFIPKPFEPKEVLARIQAAIRRYHSSFESCLVYDDLTLEKNQQRVFAGGTEVFLTAKEFSILSLLLSYPSKVFSKPNLYESVWQEPYAYDDNTLGVHLSNLRRKLKEKSGKDYIETVWGIGYKLR